MPPTRHCERSEAIHGSAREKWIASSLALLAMTMVRRLGQDGALDAADSSLRAERSNPLFRRGEMDCFVAYAPRNDDGEAARPRRGVGCRGLVIASGAKQSMAPHVRHGLLRRLRSSQ